MPIPNRPAVPTDPNSQDYHYHVNVVGNGVPFTLSNAMGLNPMRFFNLFDDLQELAREAVAAGINNAQVHQLQPLTAVGNESIYVLEFGGHLPGPPNPPAVFLNGGIHAREWIGVEIPYLIAEYLIKNYPPPALAHPTLKQLVIRDLVNNRRIYVAPMLNPDGHIYSVITNRDWRRNRRPLNNAMEFVLPRYRPINGRPNWVEYTVPYYPVPSSGPSISNVAINTARQYTGVDINRNFPTVRWGHNEAGDDSAIPTSQSYFGPSIASELETQALQAFLNGIVAQLRASIDYHAFYRAILYPQEQPVSTVADAVGRSMQSLIRTPDEWSGYNLGQPKPVIGYYSVGTIKDYIYQIMPPNSAAFGIELDPQGPGGPAGFELAEDQIQTVFERNIRGALALIACAGQNVQLQTSLFGLQTHLPPCCAQFASWVVSGRGNQLPL